MDFELLPPHGVGPLTVGMPYTSASRALESLRDPSAVSGTDRTGMLVCRPSGLTVGAYCAGDEVTAIELWRPTTREDTVRFRGINIFELPAHDVVSRLRQLTTVTADADDPASFTAPDLLLSLWRPFAPEDDPDDMEGHYFSAVLLARPGSPDTPAGMCAVP